MLENAPAAPPAESLEQLETHRIELTAYCYRMLASAFEAEDAVQDTMVRAWKGLDRFEGLGLAAVLALPDRHQRLLRLPLRRPPAARAADGHGPGAVRRLHPGPAAARHVGPDAALQDLREDLGGVAEQADGDRLAVLLRLLEEGQRFIEASP